MTLQGSQRVKSCCSFSHSSCSAFVFLLIPQSSKLYCLHGQREGRALHCDSCYWAQRNVCTNLLNSGQFSAAEQREKHTEKQPNHCPFNISSFPSCSSSQDGLRGVSLCFLILVYCPLSALPSSAREDFFAATIPQWQPANSLRPPPSL